MKKEEKKEKSKIKKILKNVRRLIYLLFWILLINYFTGDAIFPISLSNILPTFLYLFWNENSIYIVAILIIVVFWSVGIKNLIKLFFGFFGFPIYLIYFLFIKQSYHSISFIVKFVTGSIAFTKTMKYKMILVLSFVLASYIILNTSNQTALTISMFVLFLTLFAHFLRRFYTISIPVKLFNKAQSKVFEGWEKSKTDTLLKGIREWKEMDPADENFHKKRVESLQMLWLFNRIFRRFASYLQNMQGNKIIAGYFLIAIIFTFLLSIITFALQYIALEKLIPNSFQGFSFPSFLDGLYLSFTTILTVNFGDIIPLNGYAKFMITSEIIFGLIIGVILFFIFTTIVLEKYKKDLESFILKLNSEEKEIIYLIEREAKCKVKEIIPEVIDSFQGDKSNETLKRFLQIDEEE